MAYKNRNDIRKINTQIEEINKEISELKAAEKEKQIVNEESAKQKKELKDNLIGSMNRFYKNVDPEGEMVFEDLFTSLDNTYSGSESMEFFLSRIYAFAEIMKHPYPIVIDSFREGELSTDKESRTIELFKQLPNQIVFTATLKTEENRKYENDSELNAICYDSNNTCHILNKDDAAAFQNYLRDFNISK
jgi:hypothetical protein